MTPALMNTSAPMPTLLGSAVARIPTAGKVRAGIKVLTRTAAAIDLARTLYERGVAAGHSFESIERDITAALPDLKTPLVPKNVPYFTVRADDFANPEIARQIMDAYAEGRGDGVRRLYRLPVVFPADSWQAVMPHELTAWGAHDRRYWSEYSADGSVRHCRRYAPIPTDASGRRTVRIFGGRKIVARADNGGVCDPEACPEYQAGQCNLSGRFIFFVPGIKSISAFELHTGSFYAMNNAIQRFQTVAFMRGGRISGFLDRQRTPFFLSKKLMEVPHIDEHGRAVRVKQWVIDLEAPIDVTTLLRAEDDAEALGARAVAVLEGRPSVASGDRHGGIRPIPCSEAEPLPPGDEKEHVEPQGRARADTPQAAAECAAILAEAAALGIDGRLYEEYAAKRWGPGWTRNASGRRRAREEIRGFVSDASGFRAKVEAEVRVFS